LDQKHPWFGKTIQLKPCVLGKHEILVNRCTTEINEPETGFGNAEFSKIPHFLGSRGNCRFLFLFFETHVGETNQENKT
jgi:hypothetical protein